MKLRFSNAGKEGAEESEALPLRNHSFFRDCLERTGRDTAGIWKDKLAANCGYNLTRSARTTGQRLS